MSSYAKSSQADNSLAYRRSAQTMQAQTYYNNKSIDTPWAIKKRATLFWTITPMFLDELLHF